MRVAAWLRGCAALMVLFLPLLGQAAAEPEPPIEGTVLRGGWIFDSVAGVVKRNTGIVVLSGKFFRVGADLTGRDLSRARVITLADDEYAIPGLIDMHGHYDVMLGEGAQNVELTRVDDLNVNPVVYLANGVTSTFTCGEYDPEGMLKARLQIDRGEKIGPRIFQAGRKFGVASPQWKVDASEAEVKALVDRWAELGVTGFKAYGLKPEQLRVLLDRAHQRGLTVTGHLLGRDYINPKAAILMGIDRIEHYPGGDMFPPDRFAYESLLKLDPARADFQEMVELFLEHKVYYDPTLTRLSFLAQGPTDHAEILPYWVDERMFFTDWVQQRTRTVKREPRAEPWPRVGDNMRRVVKAFYDRGARDLITLGTDNPSTGYYLPGFDAHRELYNFVVAGIPAADALRFATLNGARALDMGERLGSIDVGKWADLFVVRGNPLQDIRNTRSIRFVLKAGEIYQPDTLLNSVKGKLGPANAQEAKHW